MISSCDSLRERSQKNDSARNQKEKLKGVREDDAER
jgi:hypothetical protein